MKRMIATVAALLAAFVPSFCQSLPTGVHNEDFEFNLPLGKYKGRAINLSVEARYTGEAPSMSVRFVCGKGDVKLYNVPVGAENAFRSDCYVIPPLYGDASGVKVGVKVPQGSSIDIKSISVKEKKVRRPAASDLVFHAHLGFSFLCPSNTGPAFTYAGKSGFAACICNPIESSDGDILCYHENHKQLTFPDNKDKKSLSSKEFQSMTTECLLSLDAGRRKSRYWEGTSLCRFEDYAAICAKYGMKVTLSQHPDLSEEGWIKMKAILDRYGLSKGITIKSFRPDATKGTHANFEKVYRIFGDDAVYVCDNNSNPEAAIELMKSLNLGNARRGIEFKKTIITPELVKAARDAGMFVSVYNLNADDGLLIRDFVAMGVTEFTTDNYSFEQSWMR